MLTIDVKKKGGGGREKSIGALKDKWTLAKRCKGSMRG